MRAACGHCTGRSSGASGLRGRACGLAACAHCWKRAARSPLRASSSGVFARTARTPEGTTCRRFDALLHWLQEHRRLRTGARQPVTCDAMAGGRPFRAGSYGAPGRWQHSRMLLSSAQWSSQCSAVSQERVPQSWSATPRLLQQLWRGACRALRGCAHAPLAAARAVATSGSASAASYGERAGQHKMCLRSERGSFALLSRPSRCMQNLHIRYLMCLGRCLPFLLHSGVHLSARALLSLAGNH